MNEEETQNVKVGDRLRVTTTREIITVEEIQHDGPNVILITTKGEGGLLTRYGYVSEQLETDLKDGIESQEGRVHGTGEVVEEPSGEREDLDEPEPADTEPADTGTPGA